MTHTQGQWRSSSLNGKDYHIITGEPGLAKILAKVNCPLSYTPSYPTLDPDSRRETEANATLISAAPDLLAALVDLVEQIASYDHLYGANSCAIDPEQAKQAIAKATEEVTA